MTTYQFFTTAWTWNSILLLLSALAFGGYVLAFGQRGRPLYFTAAVVVILLTFVSPFTSFHFFDDYLPILHYRLDVEFYRFHS